MRLDAQPLHGAGGGTASRGRFPVILATGYLTALLAGLAFGALNYRAFYSRASLPGDPDFNLEYHGFLIFLGLGLAVYLGAGAAAFGMGKSSWRLGLAALITGILLTCISFSLLPWIYYPNDRYSPGFLWLAGCSPAAMLTWVLTILSARFLSR